MRAAELSRPTSGATVCWAVHMLQAFGMVCNPVNLIRGVLSHDFGRIVRNVALKMMSYFVHYKNMIVLHFYPELFSTRRQRTDKPTNNPGQEKGGKDSGIITPLS
jgi:hypothetical protein